MDTTATRMRDEWAVGLHHYLSHRLRTPPYAAAVARARTRVVCVPALLPHTQHLIDGVVWAIDDHPSWSLTAWQMVCTHVRETAERCARVLTMLQQQQEQQQQQQQQRHVLTQTTTAAAAAALGVSSSAVPVDGAAAMSTSMHAATAAEHGSDDATAAASALLSSSSTAATTTTTTRMSQMCEHTYKAHAAVQDAYIAFAVVDACVKCDVDDGGQLRAAVARDVPQLVADYCPLFTLHGRHAIVDDAVAEHRDRFLDVLRAWAVQHTLRRDTHARLAERLRYRLKTTRDTSSSRARAAAVRALRDAVAMLSQSSSSSSLQHSSTTHTQRTRREAHYEYDAAAAVVAAAAAGDKDGDDKHSKTDDEAQRGGHGTRDDNNDNDNNNNNGHRPRPRASADQQHNNSSSSSTAVMRTREAAEHAVRSFIASIAPPRRAQTASNINSSSSDTARWRCPHCGAPMASEAARSAHYRVHFAYHNVLQPELKAVRLLYPSAHAFVQHTGDVQRSGYYTLMVAALEEVYQQRGGGGGARGVVRLRTRAVSAGKDGDKDDDDGGGGRADDATAMS